MGKEEEKIIGSNVQAIFVPEKETIEAISIAGIVAVSIGRNELVKIIPNIASGLQQSDNN